MFPAEKKGEWEATRIRERKATDTSNKTEANGHADGDIAMGEAGGTVDGQGTAEDQDDDPKFEEDPTSEEGAVYPLAGWTNSGLVLFLCSPHAHLQYHGPTVPHANTGHLTASVDGARSREPDTIYF